MHSFYFELYADIHRLLCPKQQKKIYSLIFKFLAINQQNTFLIWPSSHSQFKGKKGTIVVHTYLKLEQFCFAILNIIGKKSFENQLCIFTWYQISQRGDNLVIFWIPRPEMLRFNRKINQYNSWFHIQHSSSLFIGSKRKWSLRKWGEKLKQSFALLHYIHLYCRCRFLVFHSRIC